MITEDEAIFTGGQGQIFQARDTRFNRRVLVKQLHAGVASLEESRLRFEREALVTARLQHPGIVTVYDYFEDEDNTAWCVMEYVYEETPEGVIPTETLDAILRARPTINPRRDDEGFRRLLETLISVSRTVDYAHRRGLVHRDLKCSNILVSRNRVVVIDWGVVKVLNECEQFSPRMSVEESIDSRELLTMAGDRIGTPPYTAPEQNDDPGINYTGKRCF